MKNAIIRYIPNIDFRASEAINTLATNITFTGNDTKCIQLTSCREHEGKSALSVMTWKTLADMGYKTVLIDADLRRSTLKSKYGIRLEGEGTGLSHYLSRNNIEIDDILYSTNISKAIYIPAGHDVANSMQLLSNKRLELLIEKLKAEYDYILIDTPPVGAIVDAATVARCCDGALLVVTHNKTTKWEVLNGKEQIEKAGCPVLGTVLNKVEMTKNSSKYYSRAYYSSYYSDYYSSNEGKKKETRKHD